MDKLKKLFPISFKFSKNVKSLIICAVLYLLLDMAFGLVRLILIEPIISSVLGAFLWPVYLVAFILGIILLYIAIILMCLVVTLPIAMPLFYLSCVLMGLFAAIPAFICSIIAGVFSIYCTAGCVVAVLAYAGVLGEAKSENAEN